MEKQLLVLPTTDCTLQIPYPKGLVVFWHLVIVWYFLGISTMKDELHHLSIFFDIFGHIPLVVLAVMRINKQEGFKTGISFIRGRENVLLSFVATEHFGHKNSCLLYKLEPRRKEVERNELEEICLK